MRWNKSNVLSGSELFPFPSHEASPCPCYAVNVTLTALFQDCVSVCPSVMSQRSEISFQIDSVMFLCVQ